MDSQHGQSELADGLLRAARTLGKEIAKLNHSKQLFEAIEYAWAERERGESDQCCGFRDLLHAVRRPYDQFEIILRQAGELWGERSWIATKDLRDLASTQVGCLHGLAALLESPERGPGHVEPPAALAYLRDTILCLADAKQDRHALNLDRALRQVEEYAESRHGG